MKSPLAVNSHILQVTTNLDSALRHLHEDKGEQIYWVDAVCMNQMDVEERSDQVQLIKRIYERAHAVVAYLSPEANDSSVALDKMMGISHRTGKRRAVLGLLDFVWSGMSKGGYFWAFGWTITFGSGRWR